MKESKADRKELKKLTGQMSIVEKEHSHLMVLMKECIKLNLIKGQDTPLAK